MMRLVTRAVAAALATVVAAGGATPAGPRGRRAFSLAAVAETSASPLDYEESGGSDESIALRPGSSGQPSWPGLVKLHRGDAVAAVRHLSLRHGFGRKHIEQAVDDSDSLVSADPEHAAEEEKAEEEEEEAEEEGGAD